MSRPTDSKKSSASKKKPFQPAFEKDDFEISEPQLVEAKTRGFLVRLVAVMIAAAVGATGVRGLLTGDYHTLTAVWTVAGPIMGAMVAYFFGVHRKDSG
jgi:hypothetical protein